MTAFSKELAVVSRVVCFSRLADLLHEEGTSTGIAAELKKKIQGKYCDNKSLGLVLMLVEGQDTRCLDSSTSFHISAN